MIQLAWLWLRYQPGSELAEWFRERVGTLAGRTRRIAISSRSSAALFTMTAFFVIGLTISTILVSARDGLQTA
jgi:transposase